jgi:hypothetical protein
LHEKLIIYLIGFWPSNRKDKKEKKDEKKRSNNSKQSKIAQIQQQQHDETSSNNSQNSAFETNDFNKMMGSMDGINQIPSNITKSKCVIILFKEKKISVILFIFHSQHLNHIHSQVQLFQIVVLIVQYVKVQFHFLHPLCVNQ